MDRLDDLEKDAKKVEKEIFNKERLELLSHIESSLDKPMIVLSFVWLALLVYELIRGLSPFLENLLVAIWIFFIIDFLMEFTLAPNKKKYLEENWLMAIALVVPAFRAFRVIWVLRYARAVRGLTLTRVVGSINRTMRGLRDILGRRGFGYVALLSFIVILASSAGMYYLEVGINPDFSSYGNTLWYTAMAITIGMDYWPSTSEGKFLAFLLGLFSFAVSGYVTAALASYFVGRESGGGKSEAEGGESEAAKESEAASERTIQALTEEVRSLRSEVSSLKEALQGGRRT